MSFQIPDEFLSGFKVLSDLPDKTFDRLASYIRSIPSGTGPQHFFSLLSSEFEFDNMNKVSSAIYSLGNLVLNTEKSLEDLSRVMANTYFESIKVEFNKSMIDEFQSKLLKILLSCANLKFTFKALNLVSDNDLIYRDSRVITDIRLIFDEEIKSKKRKGLIIHRLKIESSKNYQNKDLYFSLDINDLKEIQELVSRAITKEEQIKSDFPEIDLIEFTD